jgi:choline dehydrogenase-like flavoprotein
MLSNLTDFGVGDVLASDVAIVGAGPAGITLARSLARSGLGVILIDAGSDPAGSNVDLFSAATIGNPYPTESTRLSGFGGTSEHWTGVCRPLDPEDFDPRDWVSASSWPFSNVELERWMVETHEILELGSPDYEVTSWYDSRTTPVPVDDPIVRDVIFQYSPPTRFAARYRDELASSNRIRVILESTVVGVRMERDSERCQGLTVVGNDGHTRLINARVTVLAAGGIENPRILLASDDVRVNGVGNQNDLVGRYFMEHPILWNIPFLLTGSFKKMGFYGYNKSGPFGHRDKQGQWRGHLSISPKHRELSRMLGSYAAISGPGLNGFESIAPPSEVPPIAGLVLGLMGVSKASSTTRDLAKHVGSLSLVLEQSPNPASRVMIDRAKRDSRGLPATVLDWQFTELDRSSAKWTLREMGRSLGRLGIGRLLAEPGTDFLATCAPACHHMGTTRMATSARHGVVDSQGRVFGTTNLWISGSSTFPTGGYANPTLTIVALALRLAARIQKEM